MTKTRILLTVTAAALLVLSAKAPATEKSQAFSEVSAALFGLDHGYAYAEGIAGPTRLKGGRFFSTADYGYVPGGDYKLLGKNFGLKSYQTSGDLYARGQDPISAGRICDSGYGDFRDWLSDGGDCVCGVTFDKPDTEQQADRAVIYWGAMPPKPGSWGVCVQDAKGSVRKIAVDNQKTIYPHDWSTIDFPPTTVKTFYVGFTGGPDNYVMVSKIDLYRQDKKLVDNNLAIWQADAYWAKYASDKPGTLIGLMPFNLYYGGARSGFDPAFSILSNLAPFIELGGKRLFAAKGEYPVQVEKNGRTLTLRYALKFALPDGKETVVNVTAVYGVGLKGTVKFDLEATGLPEGARLGFEMSGKPELFRNDLDRGAGNPAMDIGAGKTFDTPAGPLGLDVRGTDKLQLVNGNPVRFDLLADSKKLSVSLSLPIGPEAGVQPGMLNYSWYPSLADQGDEGVAPFKMEDLELLETVDLSDPNDPHEVYDISNDPLILNWKQKGETGNFGCLQFVNDPEKAKVPATTVLGQRCRAINNKDTTYFRFNLLKARFEPQTPYLIVVEHAFDKERFGEFHAIALDPTQHEIVENNLWNAPNPMGGCATGVGPYEGTFKKEATFFFHPKSTYAIGRTTVVSLCFDNRMGWSGSGRMADKDRPDGPAVKSVSIYRVKKMPALPDLKPLLPEGKRRHLTMASEACGNPWRFSQFPKLTGHDTVAVGNTTPAQFLYGGYYFMSKVDPWHDSSLEAQRWLFALGDKLGVANKIFSQSLYALGFEGTDHYSFEPGADVHHEGRRAASVPLSPTREEFAHLGKALDKALSALGEYKSFNDIATVASSQSLFTKRNFDDFSRETGTAFKSSPVPLENIRTLLDSDQAVVDAWIKWSCQKRFEYLNWLLKVARKHRPELYLTINQCTIYDALQAAYWGGEPVTVYFDQAKLKAHGINSYHDFLKLVCIDPALYSGDGFCFVMEVERSRNHGDEYKWPSPYDAPDFGKIRDGFGGGIGISAPLYDECSKPLKGWSCQYVRDQRRFRRDFVEGLLKANAREFYLSTFDWPGDGRCYDMRTFAVPFQLLPFAKPEEFKGTISDTSKQAVIKKYADRYGLMNAGDLPTDVTLTLPAGMTRLFDLSNGIRQELSVAADRTVKIHLEQWSLKTMEIK